MASLSTTRPQSKKHNTSTKFLSFFFFLHIIQLPFYARENNNKLTREVEMVRSMEQLKESPFLLLLFICFLY